MAPDPLETAVRIAGEVALSNDPGATMRASRKRYGFTQAWLSGHLGVRRESLSRIESGHSKPTLDVVSNFARIIALAQHVRSHAALLERDATTVTYLYFRTEGKVLGLKPETVDQVARAALESYRAKREAVIEGLHNGRGGRGRSDGSTSKGTNHDDRSRER